MSDERSLVLKGCGEAHRNNHLALRPSGGLHSKHPAGGDAPQGLVVLGRHAAYLHALLPGVHQRLVHGRVDAPGHFPYSVQGCIHLHASKEGSENLTHAPY